jgi:transcriptional regulator with XRE-family HTH domain
MENKNLKGLNEKYIKKACEIIKEKRIQLGLKQEYVSEITGIPQSILSRIENGKIEIINEKLLKLLNVLEITFDDLFGTVKNFIVKDNSNISIQTIESEEKAENSYINQTNEVLITFVKSVLLQQETTLALFKNTIEKQLNTEKRIEELINTLELYSKKQHFIK